MSLDRSRSKLSGNVWDVPSAPNLVEGEGKERKGLGSQGCTMAEARLMGAGRMRTTQCKGPRLCDRPSNEISTPGDGFDREGKWARS